MRVTAQEAFIAAENTATEAKRYITMGLSCLSQLACQPHCVVYGLIALKSHQVLKSRCQSPTWFMLRHISDRFIIIHIELSLEFPIRSQGNWYSWPSRGAEQLPNIFTSLCFPVKRRIGICNSALPRLYFCRTIPNAGVHVSTFSPNTGHTFHPLQELISRPINGVYVRRKWDNGTLTNGTWRYH